ncbi:hypothetical protein F4803DRAFT_548469 [Xylaria telfairii]|nr:hypothetical protein F4803DRAFT_548469 [Xylaria telfairii]
MAVAGSTNIIIVTVVFTSLAVVFVLLRFQARIQQRAPFLADDFLIAIAVVFSLAYMVNVIYCFNQTLYVSEILGYFPLTLTKVSILLFYRRIFRGQVFSTITVHLIVLSVLWGVSFFFATLFICIPTHYSWTATQGTPDFAAHCYDPSPMFYGSAVSNMIVDILILLIPAPMVWKLNMSKRQKIAVVGIFLLGAFVVGITAIRVSVFFHTGPKLGTDYDITYNIGGVIYWSQLETAIAIICGCLPTLRIILVDPPIKRFFKNVTNKGSLILSSQRLIHSQQQSLPEPNHILRDMNSTSSLPHVLESCEEMRLESLELP